MSQVLRLDVANSNAATVDGLLVSVPPIPSSPRPDSGRVGVDGNRGALAGIGTLLTGQSDIAGSPGTPRPDSGSREIPGDSGTGGAGPDSGAGGMGASAFGAELRTVAEGGEGAAAGGDDGDASEDRGRDSNSDRDLVAEVASKREVQPLDPVQRLESQRVADAPRSPAPPVAAAGPDGVGDEWTAFRQGFLDYGGSPAEVAHYVRIIDTCESPGYGWAADYTNGYVSRAQFNPGTWRATAQITGLADYHDAYAVGANVATLTRIADPRTQWPVCYWR